MKRVISVEQRLKEIQKMLFRRQRKPRAKTRTGFIRGGTVCIIIVGYILFLLFVLWIFGVVSRSFLLYSLEAAFVLCMVLASAVAFCVVRLRNMLSRLFWTYPNAVYAIWNKEDMIWEDVPGLSLIYKKVYDEDTEELICPFCYDEDELELLDASIFKISGELKSVCSSKRDEVIKYLVSTCKIRANNRQTYSHSFVNNKSINRLKSFRELLLNAFNSNFASECIADILSGNFYRYPFDVDDYYYTLIEEDKVFRFLDFERRPSSFSSHLHYALPLLLFAIPVIYCSARVRVKYVEYVVEQNLVNAKAADALMCKLNCLESHMNDSIAFEQKTTVPVLVSADYTSYEYVPYVGGIVSEGAVYCNNKKYSGGDTIFYTYGDALEIVSYSEENDNIPASDQKDVIYRFQKKDLAETCKVEHKLVVVENRGRYAGTPAYEDFNYAFRVIGPELPGNDSISNLVLRGYAKSNSKANVNDSIVAHFFDEIHVVTSEDMLKGRLKVYKCLKRYNLNLEDELTKVKNLVSLKYGLE